ncbi:hypothetical protein RHMOL_Rhmol03G0283400 [Rhododendron molle]|uniref:Uncharacterized protein n=1 Tax=Rhododendron molle TaxID=49168 RepID=A0ACC0PKP8_RHOML|nr:hypothetical protein RHMOL_Rhmol03G0283400 [Rhododendron molle]
MSKKMKGDSMDPSTYGAYGDPKARFKHQVLMQDYRELQKETEAMRNKLESTKQRKVILLAEVRFLRRRYKYLMQNRAVRQPRGRQIVHPPNFVTQKRNIVKHKTSEKKKGYLHDMKQKTVNYAVSDSNQKERILSQRYPASQTPNPILDLNQKDRMQVGKEAILRNPTPDFDLNQKERSYCRKGAAFRNPMPVLDLNQKERLLSGMETARRNPFPAFDLNQMESNIVSENAVQSRAPIFDLNQISGEEEELQDKYEPLTMEERKKIVMRGGTDEQHNELKLAMCRNVGNGPNRVGKRKISWQDPVALEV